MTSPSIRIERVYGVSAASPVGELRFLVDRLWPRGVKKENLRLDGWLKDVAPSDGLRRWFGHDPVRWTEFTGLYTAELDDHAMVWQPIVDAARKQPVVLLYAAKDPEHNHARVLLAYLLRKST